MHDGHMGRKIPPHTLAAAAATPGVSLYSILPPLPPFPRCTSTALLGTSPPPLPPQVRIHSTTDTDFYLRARSKPIIEHSCRVRFAPFTLLDPGIHHEGTATEAAPSVAAPAAAATATVAATAAAGEAPLLQGTDPADAACREAQLQVLLRRHKLGEETGMYQQVGEYTGGGVHQRRSPALCRVHGRVPAIFCDCLMPT